MKFYYGVVSTIKDVKALVYLGLASNEENKEKTEMEL